MIIVKIVLKVLPKKCLEFEQKLVSTIAPIREETGCINYSVNGEINNQSCFIILAEWETRKDLIQHIKSKMFGILLSFKAYLSEPFKIDIYTLSREEGDETVKMIRNIRSKY